MPRGPLPYKCVGGSCRLYFTVKTGSFMSRSPMGESGWLRVLSLLESGASPDEVAAGVPVDRRTARSLCGRVRDARARGDWVPRVADLTSSGS